MPCRARVLENLVIVPALVRLITEEMNGRVLHAGDVLLRREVLQTVGFVPPSGEDVKGDLATDGKADLVFYAD